MKLTREQFQGQIARAERERIAQGLPPQSPPVRTLGGFSRGHGPTAASGWVADVATDIQRSEGISRGAAEKAARQLLKLSEPSIARRLRFYMYGALDLAHHIWFEMKEPGGGASGAPRRKR